MMDSLTNSRMQCHKTCNRQHLYAYEMLLRPVRTSEPLTDGDAFHAALERYDFAKGCHEEKKAEGLHVIAQKYAEVPTWVDDVHGWHCRGAKMAVLFSLHCDYWQHQGLEVVATEQSYELPLLNPATGASSRTFSLAGKIDRIVRLADGRLAVQEYKTTSSDIGPEADYWKRLRIDSQISGYVMAARGLGYPVETVLYDVTRKPALRPGKATPEENRKYTKDGRLFCNQRETDESPEHFSRRVYEAVVADPERYFRREEIVYPPSDLALYQRGRWLTRNNVIL